MEMMNNFALGWWNSTVSDFLSLLDSQKHAVRPEQGSSAAQRRKNEDHLRDIVISSAAEGESETHREYAQMAVRILLSPAC